MNNNLQLATLASMPGFRKVIPKEVFLTKLKQKKEALLLMLTARDSTYTNFVAMGSFCGAMHALTRDTLRVQQKMFFAACFMPLLFYGNVAQLLLIAPLTRRATKPRLHIVRSQ